jgi:hypothetical protein
METKLPSSNQTAFKWSLIYFVVTIILTYTYQFLNIDSTSAVKYIGYIPYIAFLFLAQKEYKDTLGGYLTFGQGFLTGFKYALITSILLAIFMYLYWTVLSPQVFQQIVDTTKQQLEAKGGLTDDQINMSLKFVNTIIFSISILIGGIVMGTIISLIIAAIIKKEKPPFDIHDETTYVDPAV